MMPEAAAPDPVDSMLAEVIAQINADLPPGMGLTFARETRLLGAGRAIDSLGLVTLLAALEQETSRRFGQHVSLMGSDHDGVQDIGTIGSLADYLRARLSRDLTASAP